MFYMNLPVIACLLYAAFIHHVAQITMTTTMMMSSRKQDNSSNINPVMLSPRGQSGLEAKILASVSDIGLGLALISLSYYVIGHFSGKNRVKFGNFVNFSGNILKNRNIACC